MSNLSKVINWLLINSSRDKFYDHDIIADCKIRPSELAVVNKQLKEIQNKLMSYSGIISPS